MAETFWNGEPCEAEKVRVIVADDPSFPRYWARAYVGQEREAVKVTYGGRTFYIDNDEAAGEATGWEKVTVGKGSPSWGHGELAIEREAE